jgi:non-ribosomal peptide synthetase component F
VAREARVTPGTLAQAAWAIVLMRHSGRRDVVFGATLAGRPAELGGVESMCGLFINTLPVRVRVHPEERSLGWVARLQQQLVELRQFEHTPLFKIPSWVGLERDRRLFESIVAFENYPSDKALWRWRGSLRADGARSVEWTNYPLNLVITPGLNFRLTIRYDDSCFPRAMIRQLLRHCCGVLESLATSPDLFVVDLPLEPLARRRTQPSPDSPDEQERFQFGGSS